MLKHFWFLTLLFCSIFVVTGCGGGGGGGSTTPSTLSFAVNWPERTRDLNAPSSALSFTLTVTGGADTGDLTFQANRGDNLAAHRQTYSTSQRPKRGTFPFLVRFFAQANGEGAEVAVASGNVTVNGSTTLPTVSLTGTIATVEIPAGQMVDVGQTKSLSVEAKNAEGELVVSCSLHSIQWELPKFELGFWCRSSRTRQGYAAEACDALVQYAFEALGARRVEALPDEANAGSRAVCERVGLQLEGVLRHERVTPTGQLRNTCVYARIR